MHTCIFCNRGEASTAEASSSGSTAFLSLIVIAVSSTLLFAGCIGAILYCMYVKRKRAVEAIFANHIAQTNVGVAEEPGNEGEVVSTGGGALEGDEDATLTTLDGELVITSSM